MGFPLCVDVPHSCSMAAKIEEVSANTGGMSVFVMTMRTRRIHAQKSSSPRPSCEPTGRITFVVAMPVGDRSIDFVIKKRPFRLLEPEDRHFPYAR